MRALHQSLIECVPTFFLILIIKYKTQTNRQAIFFYKKIHVFFSNARGTIRLILDSFRDNTLKPTRANFGVISG